MKRVLISNSFNPYFNLALENKLFSESEKNNYDKTLYFWRNTDVVVIGRFQNPWKECNLAAMEKDNVVLMRRDTGGGAVFQDTQNLCFTFIGKTSEENYRVKNTALICKALANLGFTATPSGRNDILVNDAKISGSAFREKEEFYIHHGTVLIATDLNRLSLYLQPDKKKLLSKGISSVRSRVTNLKAIDADIQVEQVINAIQASFLDDVSLNHTVHYIDESFLQEDSELKKEYVRLFDWNWRFGKSPSFTHLLEDRFDWGGIEIHLKVEAAILKEIEIFSDSLDTEFIQNIKAIFDQEKNKPYDVNRISSHFKKNSFIDIANLLADNKD